MALVRRFQAAKKDSQRVHGPVECGYSVFESHGVTYVQLDTYGSEHRDIHGKISQSVQLDRAGAQNLMGILREAFPGL